MKFVCCYNFVFLLFVSIFDAITHNVFQQPVQSNDRLLNGFDVMLFYCLLFLPVLHKSRFYISTWIQNSKCLLINEIFSFIFQLISRFGPIFVHKSYFEHTRVRHKSPAIHILGDLWWIKWYLNVFNNS